MKVMMKKDEYEHCDDDNDKDDRCKVETNSEGDKQDHAEDIGNDDADIYCDKENEEDDDVDDDDYDDEEASGDDQDKNILYIYAHYQTE